MIGKPAARGFSLAEMLVALAVLALAAVLLAAMVSRIGIGVRVWQGEDRSGQDLAAAALTLRQRLALMQPISDIQAGSGTIDFDGTRSALDFIAPAPDREAPDALRRYRLVRDPAGNLVLYSLSTLDARVDAHAQATRGWVGEVLIGGITRLEIRYWGRAQGAQPGWQGVWTHRRALPQLVAIRVGFAENDRRTWPDLIVHPLAATREACGDNAPCAGPA